MYTAQQDNMGPFSIRYPRGNGVMTDWKTPMKAIKVGTGRKVKSGEDLAVLTFGAIGNEATKAIEQLGKKELSIAHYDMRFVKPIDELLLHEIFGKFDKVITVEDGCIIGGFGSAVIEFMVENEYTAHVKRLGIPDEYIEHGTQPELYAQCEYDAAAIEKHALKMLEHKLAKNKKLVG